MENNIKFRNHISIVAEQSLGMVIFLFVIAFSSVFDNAGSIVDSVENGEVGIGAALSGAGIVIFILLLAVLYQIYIWSKTYISISDNSVVLEKNTLTKKKHTIGIKNISNVNIEQNLLEMVLGTSKIKLDTNSLSTSDKTDVKIVLKKSDAEAFRKYLMNLMAQSEGETEGDADSDIGAMQYDIVIAQQELIVHGLFSINLFSVLVVIGSITIGIKMFLEIFNGLSAGGAVGTIMAGLTIAAVFASAFWDIAKNFVKYYNFKIKRAENKLHIRYGYFKKVNYTIPIDKISALKLRQSLLGRINHRYMAEIINIGMGDDKEENQSFLLPYCKKNALREDLKKLLPEFADVIEEPVAKQTKETWLAWSVSILLYFFIAAAGSFFATKQFPEYGNWIVGIVAAISIWAGLMLVLSFFLESCTASSRHIILVRGCIQRTLCYIPYQKIQYIRLKQNYAARRVGIQRGTVFLLASSTHRSQNLPYFKEEKAESIKKSMILP